MRTASVCMPGCAVAPVSARNSNGCVLAADTVEGFRQRLGVQRLHAAELGNKDLPKIAGDVYRLVRKLSIRFDIYAPRLYFLALIH